MAEVWFIRHGESESNANLPTTHPATSALTPKGISQAQAIARSFDRKPSLIVVSPYVRARQTAELTIARFEPVAVEEWPVQEFTPLDPAHYLNTTIEEREPLAIAYWQRNDPQFKDGGVGESFAEFLERVREAIGRLHRHPADFIALFSHGFFLHAVLWSLLTGIDDATPATMQRYFHFSLSIRMPNAAILKARFGDGLDVSFSGFDTTHLPPGADSRPAAL